MVDLAGNNDPDIRRNRDKSLNYRKLYAERRYVGSTAPDSRVYRIPLVRCGGSCCRSSVHIRITTSCMVVSRVLELFSDLVIIQTRRYSNLRSQAGFLLWIWSSIKRHGCFRLIAFIPVWQSSIYAIRISICSANWLFRIVYCNPRCYDLLLSCFLLHRQWQPWYVWWSCLRDVGQLHYPRICFSWR
jgi:hypothetical protein